MLCLSCGIVCLQSFCCATLNLCLETPEDFFYPTWLTLPAVRTIIVIPELLREYIQMCHLDNNFNVEKYREDNTAFLVIKSLKQMMRPNLTASFFNKSFQQTNCISSNHK